MSVTSQSNWTMAQLSDKDNVANAIYQECKDNGKEGCDLIANIINNRIKSGLYGSKCPLHVIETSPEFPHWGEWITWKQRDDKNFQYCQGLASSLLKGRALPDDKSEGALWFYKDQERKLENRFLKTEAEFHLYK